MCDLKKVEMLRINELLTRKSSEVHSVFRDGHIVPYEYLYNIVSQIWKTLQSGNKVAFLGNGGSAAEAMHIAAEFTGKCVIDHPPIPVMCLNESQSSITAIANDFGFEYVFSRQVEAHLQSGDLLICLSTSGKSKNVINAIDSAQKKNIKCMLWMGNFETTMTGVEIFKANATSTPRIQELHLIWGHVIAEVIESLLSV